METFIKNIINTVVPSNINREMLYDTVKNEILNNAILEHTVKHLFNFVNYNVDTINLFLQISNFENVVLNHVQGIKIKL
jgi:hypothetical protein